MSDGYFLIDSGGKRKLEQFGLYRLIRPAPQALWEPKLPEEWERCDAEFNRMGNIQWDKLPSFWHVTFDSLQLKLMPTDFGHLGLFPEHKMQWEYLEKRLSLKGGICLNLFAYSGAATLAFAKSNIPVCHVDASKKSVQWAKENAYLNQLSKASIRWIVDDVLQYLRREVKRGTVYQAILLDPPSFGRGNKRQVFKIERDLCTVLQLCMRILDLKQGCLILTCHTPGLTPMVLGELIRSIFPKGILQVGEMLISSHLSYSLPSGSYVRWLAQE